MPALKSILLPACVKAGLNAQSRKRTLEIAGSLLAEAYPELSAEAVFDALQGRERLGSTALGDGVAIPHCRATCRDIAAALLRLDEGVDFDAPDGSPVDLLFVLVVPETEASAHLELLAQIAALFSDAANLQRLRAAPTDTALFELVQGLLHGQAA